MALIKPKNHTLPDMYRAWCALQLKENSNYFDEHDTQMRWKGIRIIYDRTKVPTQVVQEVPSGARNGKNKVFQTANKHWVEDGTVKVYKNGVLQKGNSKEYYPIAGKHLVMMIEPPIEGDIITISYDYYNHPMIMSYIMFRLIIEMHNKYAATALIEGHKFDLGSGLGYLFPARIERHFSLISKIDVRATVIKRRSEPDHPPIYFTSPDYCCIKWNKMYQIANESVYKFITAVYSLRKDFHIANKINPLLKSHYKFYPVQRQQSA